MDSEQHLSEVHELLQHWAETGCVAFDASFPCGRHRAAQMTVREQSRPGATYPDLGKPAILRGKVQPQVASVTGQSASCVSSRVWGSLPHCEYRTGELLGCLYDIAMLFRRPFLFVCQ